MKRHTGEALHHLPHVAELPAVAGPRFFGGSYRLSRRGSCDMSHQSVSPAEGTGGLLMEPLLIDWTDGSINISSLQQPTKVRLFG